MRGLLRTHPIYGTELGIKERSSCVKNICVQNQGQYIKLFLIFTLQVRKA